MEITGSTADVAVRAALDALLAEGVHRPSRHGGVVELTAVTLRVTEAFWIIEGPGFDPRLAAAEALHLIAGTEYGPRIREITGHLGSRRWEPGPHTFGVRLRDPLADIVGKLANTPETRQAYAPIWRPEDANSGRADFFCATGLQFLARDGDLGLVVTWRSNDATHGLPYNLFAFGQLQATMARCLGLEVGRLTFNVGSLHLYDRHLEQAEDPFLGPHLRADDHPVGVGRWGRWGDADADVAWAEATVRAAMILQGPGPFDPTPSERHMAALLA